MRRKYIVVGTRMMHQCTKPEYWGTVEYWDNLFGRWLDNIEQASHYDNKEVAQAVARQRISLCSVISVKQLEVAR